MKTALQIDISFKQILDLVRKLPNKQKMNLREELDKEGIKLSLSQVLDKFITDELSLETIDRDVEIVRQELYEKQKH